MTNSPDLDDRILHYLLVLLGVVGYHLGNKFFASFLSESMTDLGEKLADSLWRKKVSKRRNKR